MELRLITQTVISTMHFALTLPCRSLLNYMWNNKNEPNNILYDKSSGLAEIHFLK